MIWTTISKNTFGALKVEIANVNIERGNLGIRSASPTTARRLEELERLGAVLESSKDCVEFFHWLLANCKIIHWPGGGHYPIEHAPAANKDSVMFLKMAMNKEGMYAAPLPTQPAKEGGLGA